MAAVVLDGEEEEEVGQEEDEVNEEKKSNCAFSPGVIPKPNLHIIVVFLRIVS